MARGAERRALIAATILIWAMGSMLYAHVSYLVMLHEKLTMQDPTVFTHECHV